MAAISPLASWSDQGMPARPQYSSVRRGSNMRRKLTLPVEPPVAMITALRARMLSVLPLLSTAMPSDAAGVRRFAVDRGHAVFEQNLDAGFARGGLERPHQAVAGRRGRALLPDRPACRSAPAASPSTRSACSRGTELPTECAAAGGPAPCRRR